MRVSLEQPLPMFQNLWLRRLEMPLTSKVEELLSVTLVAILLDCLLQIFPWNRSICHTRLRPSHPRKEPLGTNCIAHAICDVSTTLWLHVVRLIMSLVSASFSNHATALNLSSPPAVLFRPSPCSSTASLSVVSPTLVTTRFPRLLLSKKNLWYSK